MKHSLFSLLTLGVLWGSLQSALCLHLGETALKGQYSPLSFFALGLRPPKGKIVTDTQTHRHTDTDTDTDTDTHTHTHTEVCQMVISVMEKSLVGEAKNEGCVGTGEGVVLVTF